MPRRRFGLFFTLLAPYLECRPISESGLGEGGLARDRFFARFNSDPESQRWYFGSLVAAFRSLTLDDGALRLLARLERAVVTMFLKD
jgi:hypothetical protein